MQKWKRRSKKRKAASKPFPPGYVKCLEDIGRLIQEWIRAEPSPPDLKFHEWGKVCFTGALSDPETVRYLAASPDAERMLLWVAEQTNGEATLLQAKSVLEHLGAFRKPEAVKTSRAFQTIESFANATGTTTRTPPSPCGHCGRMNEAASGLEGSVPEPGAFSVCVSCGGINQLDGELKQIRIGEEELAELPEDFRAHVLEMQALIRNARMMPSKKSRSGPPTEA